MGKMTTGHFPGRAKRVIDIHMKGAVSQVDTFDYKPEVIKHHGEEIPPSVKGNAKISSMSNGQTSFPLMGPLAPFRQYGQCGRWVSDLMPYIGSIADDLTFIHSIWTPQVNHDPADILLHTGFQLPGRPAAGAWVNYALGTDNANLPSYVVMKSQFQAAGVGATQATWSAGFLPSNHQGVEFRSGNEPVLYVSNPDGMGRDERRAQMDVIDQLSHYQYQMSGDPEILSKIAQYEMAYRMQHSVPDVTDLRDEPDYILNMYGPQVHQPGTFARNCLLTRRPIAGPSISPPPLWSWTSSSAACWTIPWSHGRASSAGRSTPRAGSIPTRAATTTAAISPCGWRAAGPGRGSRTARPTTSVTTSSRTRSRSTT